MKQLNKIVNFLEQSRIDFSIDTNNDNSISILVKLEDGATIQDIRYKLKELRKSIAEAGIDLYIGEAI